MYVYIYYIRHMMSPSHPDISLRIVSCWLLDRNVAEMLKKGSAVPPGGR